MHLVQIFTGLENGKVLETSFISIVLDLQISPPPKNKCRKSSQLKIEADDENLVLTNDKKCLDCLTIHLIN